MTTLYQTEWCPSSHRVRQRLTELGLEYVIRQVPVSKSERRALIAATGCDTIPVLVTDAGDAIQSVDAILAYLDGRLAETPDAAEHRARADHHQRRACAELQVSNQGGPR